MKVFTPVCSNMFQAGRQRFKPDVLKCLSCAVNIFPSVCVIKRWFCVEADVTTCLLEKEEDTCTEKVLVASLLRY